VCEEMLCRKGIDSTGQESKTPGAKAQGILYRLWPD
jgi:hypothetical protein